MKDIETSSPLFLLTCDPVVDLALLLELEHAPAVDLEQGGVLVVADRGQEL